MTKVIIKYKDKSEETLLLVNETASLLYFADIEEMTIIDEKECDKNI
jgi:hypothetical protein